MTKLNFSYRVIDINGVFLQKQGHFNYSVSHYIGSLFAQKGLALSNASTFHQDFDAILKRNQLGRFGYAIYQQNFGFLSQIDRIRLMRFLHSFGYFAMRDLTNSNPLFLKKGRVYYLACGTGETMCFHYQKITVKKQSPASCTFHTSFAQNWQTNLNAGSNGTFMLDIIDPSFNWSEKEERLFCETQDHQNQLLKDLKGEEFNFSIGDSCKLFDIHLAFCPLADFANAEDQFSDGRVFIYTVPHQN